MTWAPGGNLPPLLAAAALLRARGHEVEVLASDATRAAAERAGFPILRYTRAAAPDPRVAFERRAEALMAAAAGLEIALDVCDRLRERRADLALVDCMLPAATAAAEATGTPAASLVHFLYGPARRLMLDNGITWTTDVDSLNATRRALSLAPLDGPRRGSRATSCWSPRRDGSISTSAFRRRSSTPGRSGSARQGAVRACARRACCSVSAPR